jgi:hypothetical protein
MVLAVSRGAVVGPTCPVGPQDAIGPGGPPACGARVAGGWRQGQGRAVTERNPRKKKTRVRWDTSRLTGADNASNRSRNKDVCQL